MIFVFFSSSVFLYIGLINFNFTPSLPNGHINLAKYKELAELTKEIISWKFVRCQFVKIQHVFNSVQALPIFSEDGELA